MRSQRKKVDPTLPNENGPPCFNQWIESPIRLNSGNFTPIDDSPISNVLLVFIRQMASVYCWLKIDFPQFFSELRFQAAIRRKSHDSNMYISLYVYDKVTVIKTLPLAWISKSCQLERCEVKVQPETEN